MEQRFLTGRCVKVFTNNITSVLLIFTSLFSSIAASNDFETTASLKKDYTGISNIDKVSNLDTSLFGEEYNNYSGTVKFKNYGAQLKPIGNLNFTYTMSYDTNFPEFTGWLENIPRIEVSYAMTAYPSKRTFMSDGWATGNHCSGNQEITPPSSGNSGSYFDLPRSFFSSPKLVIPNKVNELLLINDNPDSNSESQYITNSGWTVECYVDPISGGEGFKAFAPNGNKYYFTNKANIAGIHQKTRKLQNDFSLKYAQGSLAYTDDTYSQFYGIKIPEALFVSKIEDRFGNWIKFQYTPQQFTGVGTLISDKFISNQLSKVSTSDGQIIALSYDGLKKQVSLNGRHWKYSYNELGKFIVELPSKQKWQYDLSWSTAYMPDAEGGPPACYLDYSGHQNTSMSIVHPLGAVVDFSFDLTRIDTSNQYSGGTTCRTAVSLKTKTITYNNNASYTWQFAYSTNEGARDGATISDKHKLKEPLPESVDAYQNKIVTITQPDQTSIKYYVNRNEKSESFGSLTAIEYFDESSVLLKSIESLYVKGADVGSKIRHRGTWNVNTSPMYLTSKLIEDQQTNDKYLTEYSEFNFFGVPQTVYEKFTDSDNTVENERYYSYGLFNDFVRWHINQPATTSISTDGINFTTINEIEYYPSDHDTYSSLPKYEKYFGTWQKYYKSYHVEGNVSRIEYNRKLTGGDGIWNSQNRFEVFSNYKRGIAQTITVPNRYRMGSVSSLRVVDDNGLITSITDFNGNTTGYSYDNIGRIQTITAPTAKVGEPNWLDTLYTWSYDGGSDSTQPKLKVERCILKEDKTECTDTAELLVTTIYDSLLRPLNTQTTDGNNSVYQNSRYNAHGNLTFKSFLSKTATELLGSSYEYDGLQRQTKHIISNSGYTTTEYITGNKIKITDAGKNINNTKHTTTTTYLAYGSPNYEQVTKILSPEGVTTDISVNIFGKTESITQTGTGTFTTSQTETRLYNTAKQLCMIKRSDVGNTYFERETNGEISWQAQGVSGTSCSEHEATSRKKVTFSYDNVGEQHSISYGDGTAARIFSFDNNGNVKTIYGDGFNQSYNYNSLNLLEDEVLTITGRSGNLKLDYGYDSLGNFSSLRYPDGLAKVDYVPNAFGQATQAIRTYTDATKDVFVKGSKSKATYYANGSIDTFTYGNNIVHKTTLNDRRMPAQITDKLGSSDRVNLSYLYDNNNNITKITNTRDAGIYSLSNLTYDGLDRLKSTTGGNGIGSTTLTYDGLGNIRKYKNTGAFDAHDLTYSYSNNRLSHVVNTGTTTKVRDFSAAGSYDARGNVLKNGNSDEINTFSYNIANQMTSAGGNSYVYDGYNRRIKAQDSKGISYSMYSQSGKLLYRETPSGGINYILFGSKLVAKEGTGVVSSDSIMNYKPFGDSIETPKDDVGYTGHKFDTDLGLSYMQARYYDPVIGRFYSNDPIGYTAKNPVMSFNRYMYVNNNPYKYTDPDGKLLNFAIGALIGGIAEVASQAIAGKGFNGNKIAASMVLGGVTSGLSIVASAGKALSVGSKVFNGSLSATGAAGESMIHDSLDGKVADLGKAFTSAVTSVPLIGNASTLSKIVGDTVGKKVANETKGLVSEEVSEVASKLAGGSAAAVVGSGVKGLENSIKE